MCLSPTAYAAELTATDETGRIDHANGLPGLVGLEIVPSPRLAEPMVYDEERCYLVLGHDSAVTLHDDFQHDAVQVNMFARVNVGVPVARKRSGSDGDARRVAGRRDARQGHVDLRPP